MSDTPLHSAGFPGYCSLMDVNGCVVTCMRFPLLFEPLKIYREIVLHTFHRLFICICLGTKLGLMSGKWDWSLYVWKISKDTLTSIEIKCV